MNICCETLGCTFDLPEHPERIVSLNAGTTETLIELGCGDRLAGISKFCAHYISGIHTLAVGDYFSCDEELLESFNPDLILTSTGVQRGLALELAGKGWPVYALPLPGSIYGVFENTVTVAGLVNEMEGGRNLCDRMMSRIREVADDAGTARPNVYIELWIGEHVRTIGGKSYVQDMVSIAGGDPVFSSRREGYIQVTEETVREAAETAPDIVLGYSEPEYPVDFEKLIRERGWHDSFSPKLIESKMERKRSIIHEGPSMVDTIEWLHGEMRGLG